MIRDMTLGQYYPVDSPVHRLDPRVKFIGTIVYLVSLFLFDTFYGFILSGGFLLGVVLCAKIPFKFIFKGLKAMWFLIVFMMLFNLFLTAGEILASFWIFTITKQGIRSAIFMGLRLTFLILGSSIMTYTTTPNKLTDGNGESIFTIKIYKSSCT